MLTTKAQVRPSVSTEPDGAFVVIWQSNRFGTQFDIVGRRFDASGVPGNTFTVATNTHTDMIGPLVSSSSAGTFVIAWTNANYSYSIVSEVYAQRYSIETTTTTLPPGACGPTPKPESSCHLADPVRGVGASSLVVQRPHGDVAGKDRLRWKWRRGDATDPAVFAAPDTGAATYRVCVYQANSFVEPAYDAAVEGDGIATGCGAAGCWTALGPAGAPTSYRYASSSTAIRELRLTTGDDGAARLKVQAKNVGFIAVSTPQLPIVAQLLINDGVTTECFQTTFPGVGGTVKARPNSLKLTGP